MADLTDVEARLVRLTALAAARASLAAQIEAVVDSLAEIDAAILAEVDNVEGTYPAGPVDIQVSRTYRLDLPGIEDKYPPTVRPELYDETPHVTTALVRKHIAPADLDVFLKPSRASVKVK